MNTELGTNIKKVYQISFENASLACSWKSPYYFLFELTKCSLLRDDHAHFHAIINIVNTTLLNSIVIKTVIFVI